MKRQPVENVTVQFTSIELYLWQPQRIHLPPDDGVNLPWCWGASTTLKFQVGQAKVAKRVKAKWHYPEYYNQFDELHPDDAECGKVCALNELNRLVARHGLTLPPELPQHIQISRPAHPSVPEEGHVEVF